MNAQLQAANKIIADQVRTIAKMNQQITTTGNGNGNGSVAISAGEIMENVIVKGDLSKLAPAERSQYYMRVCESVGLNPLTKPFEYITLNGKLTLYALRACTDQLRAIHKVSVVDLTETERDGVFIVTAKMENGEGRTDMAKGAVTIQGLKGDALANAIMKAETKAKRRATLSLCGLGFLDETEIETIPESSRATLPKKDSRDIYAKLQEEINTAQTREGLQKWGEANKERIAVLPVDWQNILRLRYQEKIVDLQEQERGSKHAAAMPNPADDITAWLGWLDDKLGYLTTQTALENYWNTVITPIIEPLFPPDQEAAIALFAQHETRITATQP